MGLDIYDALSAIGAGGEVYGRKKDEEAKNALIQKLEVERENRAEQRQIASEQRKQQYEATLPAGPPELVADADGAHWMQYRNNQGKIIKRELASADQIDQKNMIDKKEKLGLDFMQRQIDEKKAQAAALPVKAGLEAKLTQAEIDNYASEREARLHPRPTAPSVTEQYAAQDRATAAAFLADAKRKGYNADQIHTILATAPLPVSVKRLLGYSPGSEKPDTTNY